MTSKNPKLAFQILLGTLMLTFFIAACNNNSKTKETKTDSTKVEDTTIHGKPTDSGN